MGPTHKQRQTVVIKSIAWRKNKEQTKKTLMILYRALIRVKLDYGAIVYNSATKSTIDTLNSVPNEALRTATGSFKSTPIKTLYTLANKMTLHIRRSKL